MRDTKLKDRGGGEKGRVGGRVESQCPGLKLRGYYSERWKNDGWSMDRKNSTIQKVNLCVEEGGI